MPASGAPDDPRTVPRDATGTVPAVMEVRGASLVRNTGLNLLGQALPAIAALVCIPFVIRGLGVDRFGVLSLAWVALGYLSLFDIGLGRATTRFVARALGEGAPETIPSVVWTSLPLQFALGAVGGALLALGTPLLVEHVLKVPPGLVGEAETMFRLLALSLPVLICTASLKGVLEAHQRFGLVNIVRSASGASLFVAPALGVALGMELPGVMALLVASLFATALAYGALDAYVAPSLRHRIAFDRRRVIPMFVFGGWVTVCGVLVPILIYSDRFFLAAFASVTALAYYAIPYEMASRTQVIPGSFATVLFPAFSTVQASGEHRLAGLYTQSLKYLVLVMAPVTIVLVLAAHSLLRVWLGEEFATRGGLALQVIALGVFFNALAQLPANLLDAVGRPDLRAKIFASYLPIYLVLAYLLVSRLGVNGAALAWALRAAVELLLFFTVAARRLDIDWRVILNARSLAATVTVVLVLAVAFVLGALEQPASPVREGLAVAWLLVAGVLLWFAVLNPLDKADLRSAMRALPGLRARPGVP